MRPLTRPLCGDRNDDNGLENSTSNQRSPARNQRRQTSRQNRARQLSASSTLDTYPGSPLALLLCVGLWEIWQKTRSPPSPSRLAQKSNRWRPTAAPPAFPTGAHEAKRSDRAEDLSDSGQDRNKFSG